MGGQVPLVDLLLQLPVPVLDLLLQLLPPLLRGQVAEVLSDHGLAGQGEMVRAAAWNWLEATGMLGVVVGFWEEPYHKSPCTGGNMMDHLTEGRPPALS